MADHAGNFVFATETGPSTTNSDFGALVEPDYLAGWTITEAIFGGKDNTQPITAEVALDRAGVYTPGFAFLDFYNHIHVSASIINLGNVISLQEREISVFNAFFVPHTLNAVTAEDDDGLELVQPQMPPYELAPLQELVYILRATTIGPPTIDAHYVFDFDIIDFDVFVVGVRVVAWYWEPNWLQPVRQRVEFKTAIPTNYDGSEQRIAYREFPRVEVEFLFDIPDAERRTFENIIYQWGARIWAVPMPWDIWHVLEDLIAGQAVIPVETATRDFHVDGLVLFIGEQGYESAEILELDADSITLKRPLLNNWHQGTRIYPARTARLLSPRGADRFTRNYVRGVAHFRSVEEIVGVPLVESTVYRGYPVMINQPNWREAPSIEYDRKIGESSSGYGRDRWTDESELAIPVHNFQWSLYSRADAFYFWQWCLARRGRQKALWLPTWSDDLVVVVDIGSSSTNIDVQFCGLVNFAVGTPHRRDIRVELKDGTLFYRRSSGYVAVSQSVERMTIDSAFSQLVRVADIERISWMNLVRLDGDTIETAWAHASQAETEITLRGPRNAV